MTLDFNTVFIIMSTLVFIFGIVALILTTPGAKRPKNNHQ